MQGAFKEEARRVFDPLVEVLARVRLHPTAVTLAGLALAGAAGWAIAAHRLRLGALCLILSALCDILDGQLARRQGSVSPTGAFLDSCVDRLAEGAVFVGLAVHLMSSGAGWVALAVLGLIASTMVSYARARAEGLGLDGKVGMLERPERLVVLIVALLLGGTALRILLIVLTLLAFWTFLARVRHVERQVRAGGVHRIGIWERPGSIRGEHSQGEEPPCLKFGWPSSASGTALLHSCKECTTTRTPRKTNSCPVSCT